MATCRCCGNKNARVMAPLCDRCFLGWNDCCAFRIALEQAIADSADQTCGELGFYEVPFDLQLKRINASIKKAKELEAQTA